MRLNTGTTTTHRGATAPRRRQLGIAVAVCLLAAGCGSSADEGGSKKPSAPTSKSSALSSPSVSPSPSPTSTPSPTYKATKDLDTCSDGECTVEVKQGTVIQFGEKVRLAPLNIDVISPSGVDMTSSGSGMLLSLSGQTPDQGGASTLNETDIAVLGIEGDTAVLHISPTKK